VNFQTVRKREPRQEAVVAAYARVQYLQQPGQAMMSRSLRHAHTVRLDSIFGLRIWEMHGRFLATLPHQRGTNEKYVQCGMGEVREAGSE